MIGQGNARAGGAAALLVAVLIFAVGAPARAETPVEKGNRLLAEGKYEEALSETESMIRDAGLAPQAYDIRGLALYSLGRHAEAKSCFEKAVELLRGDETAVKRAKTDLAMACTALAVRARDAGRPDEATREIEQALLHDPDYGYAAYVLGLLLDDAGRSREAVVAFESAGPLMPDDGAPWLCAGTLRAFFYEYPEAKRDLENFLRVPGGRPADRARALHWLGFIAWDGWDLSEARERFRRALEADPSHSESTTALAEVEKAMEGVRRTVRAEGRLAGASAAALVLYVLGIAGAYALLRRRGLC